jgi:imidazolonepropionase
MSRLLITRAKALVGTHAPGVPHVAGPAMAQVPLIEDAWLLAEEGRITAMGPMREAPPTDTAGLTVIDASGRYVLPAWCDPHTHTVFAAPREAEFVDKIRGLSYQEIATRGGGILNSAARLRHMDEDTLFAHAHERLQRMMRMGTGAIEIKSGYGLSLESELKMLRVVRRLKEALPLPIKATLLAAHALPPEFKDDRTAYVDMIVRELVPCVAAEGLADHVDVFCETNYFTVAEMERVLEAGSKHGLSGKVHVNQFTSIGGIPAAIAYGALSVDHLEVMTDADIEALGTAWRNHGRGPYPTLLPSCSFFLRIPYAPARRLIDQGLPVALATDLNPGTTPSGNMNLVWSLACIQLRMLPEEAFHALTLNAAAAMGLAHEVGSITPGKRANLIITRPVPSLAYMPYAFGDGHVDTVIIDGRPIDRSH